MLEINKDLKSHLNFIYEVYVLEDDNNLDDNAKELKEHYKYVIEDMVLHNCLKIEKKTEEKSKC